MNPNQFNTTQGENVEHLLANSMRDFPNAWGDMFAKLGYTNAIVKNVARTGGAKRKADVQIDFNSNHASIGVSVKSFTGPIHNRASNQIERRLLSAFCQRNKINTKDESFLEAAILRKANGKKTAPFILPNEQQRVRGIFAPLNPAASALVGDDHPQVFAIYHIDQSRWHLYDMANQVTPLCRCKVNFSTRGNITIGDYVLIQRKAGDKSDRYNVLTDIRHPANSLQVKMRVPLFFAKEKPVAYFEI